MKFFESVNWPITLCCLVLLSISILVIYSSSGPLSLQQSLFAMSGLVFFFFLSKFDYRTLSTLVLPLYILTVFLLALVFILGVESRGSIRWIPLGLFNIQPSEFAKPVLILLLAHFWSQHYPSWSNILKSLFYLLPVVLLVFKQPDLGTALTLGTIWFGLLLSTNLSFKKGLSVILILLIIMPIFWLSLHTYQQQRITSFLAPARDPLGEGYNLIQSTIAVGSGQIFGRGLGLGTQSRLQFLPEYRTDFIFAGIAEEFGFLGSILLISIYLLLIVYCLRLAFLSVDLFGFLICSGVAFMLMFQSFVNIGMNLGILPITGITLPLISYGGSSLIATLISLGLVSSVSRFRQKVDIVNIGG